MPFLASLMRLKSENLSSNSFPSGLINDDYLFNVDELEKPDKLF